MSHPRCRLDRTLPIWQDDVVVEPASSLVAIWTAGVTGYVASQRTPLDESAV